ncbi:hypothetical protein ACE38W_14935 [Chitinophaga sp. Hz27]|uniref:hypothetical protein n=1 Tax=Chitinophaga sp. Hz27 TaxID=3347169 RepID=UPI0035D8454F
MARQVTQIQQQMLDQVAADPVLSPLLTSTSKRAIYRLWTFIQATAIGTLEQIMDVFKGDVETMISKSAPASAPWLQQKMFEFQYSADNPQIVQLIDFAPKYPVLDETLRIISRCSVSTDIANNVIIKVAQGEPPFALSNSQKSALQTYVNTIGADGISYIVVSNESDYLFLKGQVYYNGQYSDVIKDNVLQAINNFLSGLPFNGQMRISNLELAIRGVAGVTDVLLQNVSARSYNTAFGAGTYLVINNQVVSRYWPTVSGYIVGETTSGSTLSDTISFIPE